MTRVIYRAPPAPIRRRWEVPRAAVPRLGIRRILAVGLVIVAGSGVMMMTPSMGGVHSSVVPVSHPRPPRSWLSGTTIITVYGRAFGQAPILGRLGMDHSFADVARQLAPYEQGIAAQRTGGGVRIAIHLIYALATSCAGTSTCLSYLDDVGTDVVRDYIRPAARRGWLVVLDDQLGRSNPLRETERMIQKGYLAYDNVEVAFDPEFHMTAQQDTPGVPVGNVSARELNRAQATMSAYCARIRPAHAKLMLVHQWLTSMITRRGALRSDFSYVRPVVVMDGIGTPEEKARGYNTLVGTKAMSPVTLRGIKLFPPSPYEPAGTIDTPILPWNVILDRAPAQDGGRQPHLQVTPRVIVIT